MKKTAGIAVLILSTSFNTFAAAPHNTSNYFQSIQDQPQKLQEFLRDMPKGGDLHNHLSGASFSENLINYAKNDNLCVDTKKMSVYKNTSCAPENLLDTYIQNPEQYDKLVDAWSMQHFKKSKQSGHDHFFATFGKIHAITTAHKGEMLAEVTSRAGKQNEMYMELMATPDGNASGKLGQKLGYNPDFNVMRNNLLANGLRNIVANMSTTLNQYQAKREAIQACKTDQPDVGCGVKVRYEYQVYREQAPERIFAQLLAGFEAVKSDHRFVTINMVAPEDGKISMRDYHLHMQMVGYLHSVFPNVPITLHAGELTSALVSQKGLSFHINDAINTAHAKRIGHGVDITNETNESALLTEMAQKHIMVEINLSSNEEILNVEGKKHPILIYMKHHVPVALSTDDEGISRDIMTTEYVKAENEFHFTYPQFKNLVRNSIYYSFLPGKNLWADDSYQTMAVPCADATSTSCIAFLKNNEKAKMQMELEKRFERFEAKYQ